MTFRFRNLCRTLLLLGGALLLGSLAVGLARRPGEPVSSRADTRDSAVFAREVRFDHREEDGLRIRASAVSLAWKAPRLLGPLRLGFLREVEARGVRLQIDLPAAADAGRGADSVLTGAFERIASGRDERVVGVMVHDLRIEIRRPDRPEPLLLQAGYGRWRAGEARPDLGEVVRMRGGRAERLSAKAGRRLLEQWIERGTTVS